jgi:hypothetical protein
MVPQRRLELLRLSALASKTSVSTNSTIGAICHNRLLMNCIRLQMILQYRVSITPFCNCVKLFFYCVAKQQQHPLLAKRCLLQFHKYNIFCKNVNLCFYNPTACRVFVFTALVVDYATLTPSQGVSHVRPMQVLKHSSWMNPLVPSRVENALIRYHFTICVSTTDFSSGKPPSL